MLLQLPLVPVLDAGKLNRQTVLESILFGVVCFFIWYHILLMVWACICTEKVSCVVTLCSRSLSKKVWRFSSSHLPGLWGSGAGTVSLHPLCLNAMPRVSWECSSFIFV